MKKVYKLMNNLYIDVSKIVAFNIIRNDYNKNGYSETSFDVAIFISAREEPFIVEDFADMEKAREYLNKLINYLETLEWTL